MYGTVKTELADSRSMIFIFEHASVSMSDIPPHLKRRRTAFL